MSDGATPCTWKARAHRRVPPRARRALTFLARLGDKVRLPEGAPHLLVKPQERSQSYFPTGHPDIRVSVPGTSSRPSASMETLRGLKGVIISSEVLPRGHLPSSIYALSLWVISSYPPALDISMLAISQFTSSVLTSSLPISYIPLPT